MQNILGDQPLITNGEPAPANHASANYLFGLAIFDDGDPTAPGDETVRPWPRPRLIRVTMRFANPRNPEAETTHQVIFRLPERGAF